MPVQQGEGGRWRGGWRGGWRGKWQGIRGRVTAARSHLGAILTSITAVAGVAAVITVGARVAASEPGASGGSPFKAGDFIAPGAPSHPVHATLPARPMSYLGVYEPNVPGTYAEVAGFGRMVGKRPNVALYYSDWELQFQTVFAKAAFTHHAVPLVQINPRGISLAELAAGRYDGYLATYADEVAAFGHPVIIGFGHEMNGPWAGWGYTHTPPKVFIAAWRHLVTVFRTQGADNVTWLWTVNRTCPQCGLIRHWWPGSRYVTWVGIDGYYYRHTDTFKTIFAPAIAEIRRLTRDPILISETAAGPLSGQARGIRNLLAGIRAFHDLGLVWFDKAKSGSIYHQNWRLEGNMTAIVAFRQAVRLMRLANLLPTL